MKRNIFTYLKGDRIIWIVIGVFAIFSMLAVYSASVSLAYKYQGGNTFYYFLKHGIILFISFIVIYFLHNRHYRVFLIWAQPLFLLSIPLLIITLAFGSNLNEASRWIEIPIIGLTVQTSDFAKIALIMYLSKLLAQKQNNNEIKQLKEGFGPLIAPILLTVALIFPANFSTAALIFVVSLILLYIGQVKFIHIISLVAIIVVFGFSFIFIGSHYLKHSRVATWKNRIEHFWNQDTAVDESENFQANQAKIAIATAGIMGKGPGNSTQKNILPHPYSDFIFAIIVEEYGLIGAILLIGFYLILLYRAIVIVKKSTGYFASFLTIGLTLLITMQAFINIGVAINLFPVTGQTLPLISMGGTSLIFTSSAIGMILSVSRYGVQEEKKDTNTNEKQNISNNLNQDTKDESIN